MKRPDRAAAEPKSPSRGRSTRTQPASELPGDDGAQSPAETVHEEAADYGAEQRSPKNPLRILVLEEHNAPLYTAVRTLTSAGYSPRLVSDESAAARQILKGKAVHAILLTAHATTRPLSVPQIIASLRESNYGEPIACCVKGKVSAATRAAYEALSVDRTLALPGKAQRSVLEALAWVGGQIALDGSGLTVLET